ncbi:UDP-glucosyltransferase 29-like [Cryptomeria japonica]|uniref:UDP-glucosyltransferase 29-like n=1 Tax=Cryptomeria japonica TaxID=3369 RepID=UPI0027DA439F|nr:UDP-glucosyltransferase 29-like [Cryptomeria japonica]
MTEEKQRELHVVMFPWLAYGQIAPFVELAKNLASHGLKIIFVSTPLNIKRITPQVLDAPGIDLMELEIPSMEGLPTVLGSLCGFQVSNPIPTILFKPMGVAGFSFLQGERDNSLGNPIAEDLTVSPPGFPSPNIHFTLFEGKRAIEMLYRKYAGGLSVAENASIYMRESWAVTSNTCL